MQNRSKIRFAALIAAAVISWTAGPLVRPAMATADSHAAPAADKHESPAASSGHGDEPAPADAHAKADSHGGGHATADDGHGDGHGGGHHAPAPVSYVILWVVTLMLVTMIAFYFVTGKKWEGGFTYSNIRDLDTLKAGVGSVDELGQFDYRDEFYFSKVKPEGYHKNTYGDIPGHGDHGAGHDEHTDHASDARAPLVASPYATFDEAFAGLHPQIAGAHDDHGHGQHPDVHSRDSLIFAGGCIFLAFTIFYMGYLPELTRHFDLSKMGFVDGYHEPSGPGIVTFLTRFTMGVMLMVYGLLGMGEDH